MATGVIAIRGFDYQVTIILAELFDHFDAHGAHAKVADSPPIKAPDISKTASKVMVWNGPSNRHQKCLTWSRREAPQRKDRSMEKIITVGLDLAKSIFQVHGTAENGKVLVRRTLRRSQVLPFFRSLPACLVGMEACASAHHWAREIAALGTLSA